MKEGCQCVFTGALDLGQRRPTLDKITEQDRINLLKPVQCLRIILFESIAQAIGDSGPIVYQGSTLFHQGRQHSHRDTLRLKWFEVIRVV